MASQRREYRFVSLAARSIRFPGWSTSGMSFAESSVIPFLSEPSASISRSSSNIGLLTGIFGWSKTSYVTSSPVTSTYRMKSMTK